MKNTGLNCEPEIASALIIFESAKKTWDIVQINISSKNGEAKELQQEQSKAGKDLGNAQKRHEELERQHKAFVEKQNYYSAQINWLKERFPNGVYEDVIGLCKAATLVDIEEQDWSLNPGRYVGVVIEEDGLTEDEFLREMKDGHEALNSLNLKASNLEKLINENLMMLFK